MEARESKWLEMNEIFQIKSRDVSFIPLLVLERNQVGCLEAILGNLYYVHLIV
jgi:hypothetical protein